MDRRIVANFGRSYGLFKMWNSPYNFPSGDIPKNLDGQVKLDAVFPWWQLRQVLYQEFKISPKIAEILWKWSFHGSRENSGPFTVLGKKFWSFHGLFTVVEPWKDQNFFSENRERRTVKGPWKDQNFPRTVKGPEFSREPWNDHFYKISANQAKQSGEKLLRKLIVKLQQEYNKAIYNLLYMPSYWFTVLQTRLDYFLW